MGRDYIFRHMHRIKGYLDPSDALSFQAIIEYQNASALKGGGAEIGVFFGRSYFLIRSLMGPKTPVLAADLFNIGQRDDGSAQLDSLRETGRALDLPIDNALVHVGDSGGLTGDKIKQSVGPVRFFSVDGGHHLKHVRQDAIIARDALAEHGVIVFDDVYNHTWPEVAVGVFEFLDRNPDFVAFAITPKKMYVCHRSHFTHYRDLMRRTPHLSGLRRSERMFLNNPVTIIEHPIRKRISYELLTRAGIPSLASRLYPAH